MRERALRWSMNLSLKVLPVSPMYYSVHFRWSHLYLHITPPLLMMLSLSLGATDRLLMVFPLEMNLTCYFALEIPKAFSQSFGVGDHHVDIVYLAILVHMCSSVCIMILDTEVKVYFLLQFMETELR